MGNEALVGAAVAGVIELAKMGLQIWFAAMRQAGLTEAQQWELYEAQRAKFESSDPGNLPDV